MRYLGALRVVRQQRWSTGLVVAAAVVALVSFTGTAVAGGLVTGRQIKDGSLRSVDLAANRAVTGADVSDGTLTAQKLSSLPQGPRGAKGPPGPPGVDGLDNFDYEAPGVTVGAGNDMEIIAPCATGTVVGGGASSASTLIRIEESRPLADGSGWKVLVYNESGQDVTAFGWAVCVGAP